MKKMALLLGAVLLALSLAGCGLGEVSGYSAYNGVQIPDEDVANMRSMYSFIDETNVPTDEELLATLAYQQVQVDEAERLGLLPSRAEAEKNYMADYVEPVMKFLAMDSPDAHESALFYLMLLQEQGKALGLSHDEFCDYLITQWQRMMGIAALQEYVISQTGLTPGEMSQAVYDEYVDELLA